MEEPLKFESEEAKAKAISEFDEESGSLEDFDRIRNAEISEAAGDPGKPVDEAADTPANPEVEDGGQSASEESSGGESDETPEGGEPKGDAVDQPESKPIVFEFNPDELPREFKSKGDMLKHMKEANATIERQQKFIQERLKETPNEHWQRIEEKNKELETELEKLKRRSSSPVGGEVSEETHKDIANSQEKIARIQELQKELEGADMFDEKAQAKQREFNRLMASEMGNMYTLLNKAQQEVVEAKSQTSQYLKTEEEKRQEAQAKAAIEQEYQAFDSIAKKDPEYKLSRSSAEVDGEYLNWAKSVGQIYFGKQVGNDQALLALDKLIRDKPPSLIQDCRAAGIPVEPTEDMQSYLKLCELADYADGWRTDPRTGKRYQVTRYDPSSGKEVPDRISMEAALALKREQDGYYQKKEVEAQRRGTDQALDAISRRDTSDELDGTGGSSPEQISPQNALEILNSIDEEEAMRNPQVLAKFNQARKAVGLSPLTL